MALNHIPHVDTSSNDDRWSIYTKRNRNNHQVSITNDNNLETMTLSSAAHNPKHNISINPTASISISHSIYNT